MLLACLPKKIFHFSLYYFFTTLRTVVLENRKFRAVGSYYERDTYHLFYNALKLYDFRFQKYSVSALYSPNFVSSNKTMNLLASTILRTIVKSIYVHRARPSGRPAVDCCHVVKLLEEVWCSLMNVRTLCVI